MQLYNTLTRKTEEFIPLSKNVTMYVCGITPYDTTHLGHAFTYIFFDALLRYLKFKEFNVNYTQNVTDINDRDNDILKRAQEQNTTWEKLSEYWTKRFLDDMKALNWTKPNNFLYASEQIQPMIDLIQKIIANGSGYVVPCHAGLTSILPHPTTQKDSGEVVASQNDNKGNYGVYLDISKDPTFGVLSKLNNEQMMSIAKDFDEDLDNPDKRHQLDITLWRPTQTGQPKHIPSFDSPWGLGRPGWHIECSAMSVSSLGDQIDIHGGGKDLIFPHHESEITQSQSATKKIPFAKYWLHTGTVMYQGEKMSKSLGNLVLVDDLLKKYSPNAIRWVLLSHHWHEDWEFHEEELKEAEKKLEKIKQIQGNDSGQTRMTKSSQQSNNETIEQFLGNNFETSKALDRLSQGNNAEVIKKYLEILGFKLEESV